MNKMKVGIAGYGVVGKRRRFCIDNNKNLVLQAVCDRNFSGHGQFDDGIHYYDNYQDLLLEDLDILFVCLTNDIAAEVTIAAIQKGLHVFCEKPPGRNVKEIENVIECEKSNPTIKLMYGFNHRYHESVQEALRIVRDNDLGNMINIRGVYGKSKLITFNQPDWRTKREIAGGGVLLDQGIHMVDLMRLFAGEFEQVHSFVSNSHWYYDVEDNAYALMKTKKGVVGMLNSSATQWRHRFNLDMNFQRGSLILSGILSGSKSYGAEKLTIIYADPERDNGDPKEHVMKYNRDPSWEEEVRLFADYVLLNKPVHSGCSNDALKTMQLVYKIYCSDPTWKNKYHISDA